MKLTTRKKDEENITACEIPIWVTMNRFFRVSNYVSINEIKIRIYNKQYKVGTKTIFKKYMNFFNLLILIFPPSRVDTKTNYLLLMPHATHFEVKMFVYIWNLERCLALKLQFFVVV